MQSMSGPVANTIVRAPTPSTDPGLGAESGWLGTSYGLTMPMPLLLEPTPPSEAFREPLRGMAVREVCEPEVFRLFFGRKIRRY